MTALPTNADLTTVPANHGLIRAALGNMRDFLAGVLGTDGAVATALATLGALGSGYVAKTGAYSVVAADRGKFIDATANTWTLTLPAVSGQTGFSFVLRNSGAGTITLDGSGAELVDGVATVAVAPGRAVVVMCTGAAWVTHWLVSAAATSTVAGLMSAADKVIMATLQAAMTTAIDATAGAVAKIYATGGIFGWANLGTLATVTDIDALTIASGVYETSATTTSGTFPATGGSGVLGVLTVKVEDSTHITQRWSGRNSGTKGRYERKYTGGAWGTWFLIYDQEMALGTVSQASGVPTGALIERGTNANGEYARFADGSLECYTTKAASAGAAVTWTFPSAFIAAPVVTGAAVATVSSAFVLDAAPSTTAATFSARDKTDARRADTCHLVAVGRWF